MVFAVVMLTCLVAATLWCVITATAPAAWIAMAFGVLWLPANNRQLEGHVLFTVSRSHGITEGDGVGLIAWAVAVVVLLRWAFRAPRGHARSERVGLVMLLGLAALAFGALAAFETD